MRILSLAWVLSVMMLPAAQLAAQEEQGRIADNIDLPFVNDPQVQGVWTSVDFVKTPEQFDPQRRRFEDDLYLKELVFLNDGRTFKPWWIWTKGYLLHQGGDHTASRYEIKDIGGTRYMFLEWKSGDYIIRHQKPQYYVLKRTSGGTAAYDDSQRCDGSSVWQHGQCRNCVEHAHPNRNGIMCDCDEGYTMNAAGNVCH